MTTHTVVLTDEQYALLQGILDTRPQTQEAKTVTFPKGTICTGTKGDGTECHAPAKSGTDRCRHHPHGAKLPERKARKAQEAVASSTGKVHGKSLAKLERALAKGEAFESGNGTTLGELKANLRMISKARKGKFAYDSHEVFQGVRMAHHTLTLGGAFGSWDVYTHKAKGTGEKRVAGTQAFVPMG